MIVSKTPLRISFFGGGTDLPQYYGGGHDGFVISTTIDKYVYIAANRCVADHVRVSYSEFEEAPNITGIRHDRVREALRFMRVVSNIEISSFSDVPTKGTGLGSSSTFTVGLLNALQSMLYPIFEICKRELAENACTVEIDMCGQPIGKQDQYAAAFGGFNGMVFCNDGPIAAPIRITGDTKNILQNNLMLFPTGIARQASTILQSQVDNLVIGKDLDKYDMIKTIAYSALDLLEGGYIDEFGELLGQTWKMKRQLSGGVSNERIDEMYEAAIKAGALGGKLLGAGGGGYLLLYVREKDRSAVRSVINDDELLFRFTNQGSTVIKI